MSENNLSVTIQQLDSSKNTLARRVQTFTESAAVSGTFFAGRLTTTGATTITFPSNVTQVRQLALKNLHASGTITVIWTPTTGASATIAVLGAGAGLFLWDDNTHATAGISALSLTASIANTDYELFLGS